MMDIVTNLQVGQEGYMRSRARRWARVVDDATWPEVLRRYLLATRAMLPQPSAQDLASDVSCIDDDAAAVMAASILSERSFLRWVAPSQWPELTGSLSGSLGHVSTSRVMQ